MQGEVGRLPKTAVSVYTYIRRGAVAQMGERLLCTEEVRGSSPLSSTWPRLDPCKIGSQTLCCVILRNLPAFRLLDRVDSISWHTLQSWSTIDLAAWRSLMSRLFDNKPRNYTKPARRAETTYSFLDLSSKPEVGRVRGMLERWVERLPKKQQRDTVARVRHNPPGSQQDEIQFNAAFFEVFLHEFLLGTGGEVVVEPMIDGLTPDFGVTEELADGSQLTYLVEAKDIDLERGTKLERDWNELKVLDTLNEISSPDFRLHIRMEGKLESLPRKAHLKRTFEKLLRGAKYEEVLLISQGQQGLNLEHLPSSSFQHGSWTVVGHLLPVLPERRGNTVGFVGVVSMGVDNVDDIGKTKDRLYDKAKHYKNAENLIIALRCDISNDRIDKVLFGSQQFTFYVHNDTTDTTPLPKPHYSQKLNGFLVQLRWANQSACDRRRGSLWSSPGYPRQVESSFLSEPVLGQANASMDRVDNTCGVLGQRSKHR